MRHIQPPTAPARRAAVCLWALWALCACAAQDGLTNSVMSTPTGLVVAGQDHNLVFVAMRSLDALQVLDATPALPQVGFVQGPARYFPLHVPTGPNPTRLAASQDGRYVFVLDAITSQVRVVAADALQVLTAADGNAATVAVGPRQSQPAAMVGHPWADCVPSEPLPTSRCLGRAYVAVQNLGAVAAVDVRGQLADGSTFLQLDALYPIGGSPASLAAHPTLPVLFIGDVANDEVVRLVVGQGAGLGAVGSTRRSEVGAAPGVLATSADGTLLAVSRPSQQDLALLVPETGLASGNAVRTAQALASQNLALRSVTNVAVPSPTCLQPCAEAQVGGCALAHPADASLCSSAEGYQSVPSHAYDGLWLGTQAQALYALSQNELGQALAVHCAGNATAQATSLQVNQALAVAGFDGSLRFVGLATQEDLPAAVQTIWLLDENFCEAPSVSMPNKGGPQVTQVLAPAPSFPVQDGRFAALVIDDAPTAQLGLLRGQLAERTYALAWEGILPGSERPFGNGAVDANGDFTDVVDGVDALPTVPLVLQELGPAGTVVRGGDVLELTSTPRDLAACGPLQGGKARRCVMERRLVAVRQDGNGPTRWHLDRPLPQGCFLGPIAYRVRAGDSFLAGPWSPTGRFEGDVVRLYPGDVYGPGRRAGLGDAIFFRLQEGLATGVDQAACARYLEDGSAPAGAPAWRTRREALQFTVRDPYRPVEATRYADPLRQDSGALGLLPYDLALVPRRGDRPASLWLSYAASNALYATVPTDSRALGVGASGRLFQ